MPSQYPIPQTEKMKNGEGRGNQSKTSTVPIRQARHDENQKQRKRMRVEHTTQRILFSYGFFSSPRQVALFRIAHYRIVNALKRKKKIAIGMELITIH